MIERLKKRWYLGVGLTMVLLIGSVACMRLGPSVMPPLSPAADAPLDVPAAGAGASSGSASGTLQSTPVPVATRTGAATGPQLVAVQKGTILDQVSLGGQVSGQEEMALSFSRLGRIESSSVKTGQPVHEGDVLLQQESRQLQRDLTAARARLEADTLRLQQAQAAQQARQDQTARQSTADRVRQQGVIADAEAAVRSAKADLARVRAGASPAERQAALDSVNAAQLAVQRAQTAEDRLSRGANPAELRAAQQASATAQGAVDRAQADLDRLTRGADPNELRTAERDLARAQNVVKGLEAQRPDAAAAAARDAALANAKLQVQDAQDRVDKLRQPADPKEIAIVRRNLQVAQLGLESARERAQAVQNGSDQAVLDSAAADVDAAQANLQTAQVRLADLEAGPTPAAGAAAQDRVTAAQAALDRARSADMSQAENGDVAAYDQSVLQNSIEQDHIDVLAIEEDIESTRLRAPFDGTVVSVLARAGDDVQPKRNVIVVARAGVPIVRAAVPEDAAARIAVRQQASVQLDGSAETLSGRVLTVKDGRAEIGVTWSGPVVLGTQATVLVTVRQKDDALVVPNKAVRASGSRRYVEFMDKGTRRVANVETGIVGTALTEILSGRSEGDMVVVRP